jgi:hypothetical protein
VQFVDPKPMKGHALAIFGGLAAIVILVGVAFGAARREVAGPGGEPNA